MKLHNLHTSSTSYRVRIAFNLKGVPYEYIGIDVYAGKHREAPFTQISPSRSVPVLELDGGELLTQSMAVLEYIEETWPQPPLLPADALGRARVRALANVVACDMHPVNNLRILQYLDNVLMVSPQQKSAWYAHWIAEGLSALERMLANDPRTGRYCHGDAPTFADLCLVPQLANARRLECDLAPYPSVVRIEQTCLELEAFSKAQPHLQPDAPMGK